MPDNEHVKRDIIACANYLRVNHELISGIELTGNPGEKLSGLTIEIAVKTGPLVGHFFEKHTYRDESGDFLVKEPTEETLMRWLRKSCTDNPEITLDEYGRKVILEVLRTLKTPPLIKAEKQPKAD